MNPHVIVIATYNEAESIEAVVNRILQCAKANGVFYVCDDCLVHWCGNS